jgi:hypothetical protein
MDATLTLTSNTVAYGDVGSNSNPSRKYVDWSVARSYSVKNPKTETYMLAPGETLTLFSGTRSTGIDNTTEFQLDLSQLASDRYRFTWTGNGTAPGLRTDRGLELDGVSVDMTANANLTMTMAASAGTFVDVIVGDAILIPDTTTGDGASPFNTLNVGYWVVLAKDIASSTLQLTRPSDQSFSGVTETVSVTDDGQVLGFSAAGVQVGDSVSISAGFVASVLNSYRVVAVTPNYFEVIATQPLPTGIVAVPEIAGIAFYSASKRWFRIEADQECVVRLNGDTGNSNRLSPWVAGDRDNTGHMEKSGPSWQMVVVNLAGSPLNLLFVSTE